MISVINFLESNHIDFQFLYFKNNKYFYVTKEDQTERLDLNFFSIDNKICCFESKPLHFYKFIQNSQINNSKFNLLKKINKYEMPKIFNYYFNNLDVINLDLIKLNLKKLNIDKCSDLYISIFLFISIVTEFYKNKNDKVFKEFHKLYFEKFMDYYVSTINYEENDKMTKQLTKILNNKVFVNLINNVEELFVFNNYTKIYTWS